MCSNDLGGPSGPALPRFEFFCWSRRMDLTNVWGHVYILAKGAGHAVAQLDVTYGVDYEPFKVSLGHWRPRSVETGSEIASRSTRS